MTKRMSYLLIGVLLGGLFSGENAFAARHVVLLASSEVATYSTSDPTLGDFYTLQVQVPGIIQGKELYAALLEFYTDVFSVKISGRYSRTPVIEAYELKTAFAGVVNPTQFETSSVALTNVVSGQNKRVILDITAIIKSYLANPASNHGIILGSLTASRDGKFSIRSGQIGAGTVARITYHYDSRVRK